jgi:hypothetical protein
MGRVSIAYLLIALLVLALAGLIAFKVYHSHGRAYLRRTRRENAEHRTRMDLKNGGPPEAP